MYQQDFVSLRKVGEDPKRATATVQTDSLRLRASPMPAVKPLQGKATPLAGRLAHLHSIGCFKATFRRTSLVKRRVHISEHGPTLVEDNNARKSKIELPRAPNVVEEEQLTLLEDTNTRYVEKGSINTSVRQRLATRQTVHNNKVSQEEAQPQAPAADAPPFGSNVLRQVCSGTATQLPPRSTHVLWYSSTCLSMLSLWLCM